MGRPQSRLFAVELNRFAVLFGMRRPHVTLRKALAGRGEIPGTGRLTLQQATR
jgi:hypothetical protein